MSFEQHIIVATGHTNYTGTLRNNCTQFLGIPYATSARWQIPIPYQTPEWNATDYSDSCPQICRNVGAFCPTRISENCLSLNIWTPTLLQISKLPVLVFIHGGSFETGSNSLSVYDGPSTALRLNAVFVSINYRLGIFGFPGKLDNSPVNLGILDQQIALRWIHDNIQFFGGDSTRMTLMGQSAGALSAMIHLAQAPTNQWFNNGILMSPPATAFRSANQSRQDFFDLAVQSECANPTDIPDWGVLKQCLSNKTMREILDANERVAKERNRNKVYILNSLIPVVDHFEIQEHPFLLYSSSTQNKNILIGTLSNETTRMVELAAPIPINQPIVSTILTSLYGKSSDLEISKLYQIEGSDLKDDFRSNISRALTDAIFECPVRKYSAASLASNTVYKFYWELPWTGGPSDPLGNICNGWTCHSTDLVYFFNDPETVDGIKAAESFRNLVQKFIYNETFKLNTSDISNIMSIESYSPINQPVKNCVFWDQKPYLFETEYSPPTEENYSGVGSRILLISLLCTLSIFGLQIVLFIYNKYSQKGLYSRIEKVERKRTEEKGISSNSDHSIIMASLLDFIPKPIELTVHNLSYIVPTATGSKSVLTNCSFKCSPGSLTALLGPSGAGKTSLLSLIAKRFNNINAQQYVYYGNQALNNIHEQDFKIMVGFVAQYDAPYIGLTCREVLACNALLEYPAKYDKNILAQKVAYILEIMDLTSAADTVILDPSEHKGGISGGQRRKLSIAIALLKSPSVLYLDEPTSGLDAQSSLQVMTLLSQLAKQGFTVIVTIHQPRQEIFSLFSNLVILAHGQVLCSGSPPKCIQYINYLQTNNHSVTIADHILDVASSLCYQKVAKFKMTDNVVSPKIIPKTPSLASEHKEIFKLFRVINTRSWMVRPITRKISMLAITFAVSVVLGLLQRRTTVDITSITLQIKGLTVACIGLSALKNINISFDYYADRDFYNFDLMNGTVTPSAFFLHRLLYETTNATLESGLCAVFTFFILDCQASSSSFQTIVTLIIIYYNCMVSLYTLIYSTKLDRSNARSISFFAQAILAVTSGIWIKKGDTAVYDLFYWIQYVNPNYWVLPTMIRAILVGVGDCYIVIDNTCRARLGDLIIEQARIEDILPETAIQSLLTIWAMLRAAQFVWMHRDSFIHQLNNRIHILKLSKISMEIETQRCVDLLKDIYAHEPQLPSLYTIETVAPVSSPFLLKPRAPKLITLNIKPLKGLAPFTIEADLLETIAELKLKISTVSGVAIPNQRLLLSGKGLSDLRTLFDYNIKPNATLHLSVKQDEGAVEEPVVAPQPKEVKQSDIDTQVFWSKIKTVLDSKYTSEVSEKVRLN
ncbi:hypothetical protein HDV06_000713 [Boothiomyces sp. JEL0866]|nr:hypothetical protein HDV06_000713 [Boothiomyces sp. JEL0866]